MNRLRVAGIALTAVGVAAYGAGVIAAFPGRGFSLLVIMVGLTVAVIGGAE